MASNRKRETNSSDPLVVEDSSKFNVMWDDLIVPLSFRQHIQRSLMRRIYGGSYPLDYGYIIFGPPGTGKTTITKGIAKQLNWEYVYLSPKDFVMTGSPIEEVAKQRFAQITILIEKKVKKSRPSWKKQVSDNKPPVNIVFVFDEIDELVVTRTEDADRQTRLSTTMMLPLFQKLREQAKEYGFVFFVLTNHIERFDAAITRRGRFDLILPLGPPDTQGRFLLFRKFVNKLKIEYDKNDGIEIRTHYDEEGENGDIFPVPTTDFDIVSRASSRLTLEDIDAICKKVIEHEKNIHRSLKDKSTSAEKFLYLHTHTFIDFIHKFKLAADQNPEIDKFEQDIQTYSRGSTIYPKPNTLNEKIEHEFSSLYIHHNLTQLGLKWKKNRKYTIFFAFTNVSRSHSFFVGQISVQAEMGNKIIKRESGHKDEPVGAGVVSDVYFADFKPKNSGKLKIIFAIEGTFYPRGIEEVVERGSVELYGKLVYTREIMVV